MIDQPKASQLAKEAFQFWESGQAELSIPLYLQALQLANPEHYALADYHGEFAGALSSLGRFNEACEQYQLAVSVQLKQDGNNFTSGVVISRYFLADHYLQQQKPAAAIEVIEPSLKNGVSQEWLLRYIKALSLHALGQHPDAQREAELALATAPSDTKRQELASLFAKKLHNNSAHG